eukprot:RCo029748
MATSTAKVHGHWRLMILFSLVLHLQSSIASAASVGINFGDYFSDHTLTLAQSFTIIKNAGVNQIKLYDTDTAKLQAISQVYGSDPVHVIVDVTNADVKYSADASWASNLVSSLAPYKQIVSYVCIGNEVNKAPEAYPYVAASINAIGSALSSGGFAAKPITTFTTEVVSGFPPSAGKLVPDNTFLGILAALSAQGSPIFVNIYPYFTFMDSLSWPHPIDLSYALGTAKYPVVSDRGHDYTALFDAQFDTVVYALRDGGYNNMQLVIGECGWPTAGDTQGYASVANAQVFVNLMAEKVTKGTPLAPGKYTLYLFEAFDEPKKGPAPVEPHFGVWDHAGSPKYPMNWHSTHLSSSAPELAVELFSEPRSPAESGLGMGHRLLLRGIPVTMPSVALKVRLSLVMCPTLTAENLRSIVAPHRDLSLVSFSMLECPVLELRCRGSTPAAAKDVCSALGADLLLPTSNLYKLLLRSFASDSLLTVAAP